MHLQKGAIILDDTRNKILNAAMTLIMNKGYSATTTKDIAKKAGVNECTVFRKFKGKKEIIVAALMLPEWNPKLKEDDFAYTGDLTEDLYSFSNVYLEKVTPKMVKISLGLRSPDLYDITKDIIREIPDTFKRVLVKYFTEMRKREKINTDDIESLAIAFLSLNFGFVFFKASFGDELTKLQTQEYIKSCVHHFVNGICN